MIKKLTIEFKVTPENADDIEEYLSRIQSHAHGAAMRYGGAECKTDLFTGESE